MAAGGISSASSTEAGASRPGEIDEPVWVVAAAGAGRRFGPGNKLLADWYGQPVLARVLAAVSAGGGTEVVAVVGPGEAGRAILDRLGARWPQVRWVVAAGAAEGLAASLRAGVEAVPSGRPMGLALGDMPRVPATWFGELRAVWRNRPEGVSLVYTLGPEGLTPPVILGAEWRAGLLALRGDAGAGALVRAHPQQAAAVDGRDRGDWFLDVDTAEDLR